MTSKDQKYIADVLIYGVLRKCIVLTILAKVLYGSFFKRKMGESHKLWFWLCLTAK